MGILFMLHCQHLQGFFVSTGLMEKLTSYEDKWILSACPFHWCLNNLSYFIFFHIDDFLSEDIK
jgi:hypothetical protein